MNTNFSGHTNLKSPNSLITNYHSKNQNKSYISKIEIHRNFRFLKIFIFFSKLHIFFQKLSLWKHITTISRKVSEGCFILVSTNITTLINWTRYCLKLSSVSTMAPIAVFNMTSFMTLFQRSSRSSCAS